MSKLSVVLIGEKLDLLISSREPGEQQRANQRTTWKHGLSHPLMPGLPSCFRAYRRLPLAKTDCWTWFWSAG